MGTKGPAGAAIYARISQDAEGQELGVTRQVEDCRKLAAARGLTVIDVYTDNDVGASTRSRKKRRPEYDRLLADAQAGRVGVVIAYSNSRLTRRLRELEDLINLHEQHGTRILTVVSGEDNLSTADGRMVARIKASVDAAEAERTAERVTRKHLELAQAGRVVGGGHRPFGWEEDQVTVRPAEAELIRAAAADVLAGLPLRRVVDRWNAAGVTTSTGRPWTNGLVLQLLRSPRLAGWRVHRPKGTRWTAIPPVAVGRDGQPVRGEWEPILDDATHRALAARLAGNTERRSRIPKRNARRYLLTGLLRCAVCNSPMYANKVGDAHFYRCDSGTHGNNSASGRGIDALVSERVLGMVTTVADVPDGKRTPAQEKLADVEQRIADVNEMIEDVMAAFRARRLKASTAFKSAGDLESARDALLAERDTAQAEVLQDAPVLVDEDTWASYDTDQRRAVCERMLAAVYVRPAERRGNTFDASRVDLVWR
jgi:DNA invertase Pin-like site-specific DNA recombinase